MNAQTQHIESVRNGRSSRAVLEEDMEARKVRALKPREQIGETEARFLGLDPNRDQLLLVRETERGMRRVYLHLRNGGAVFYEVSHTWSAPGLTWMPPEVEYYILSPEEAKRLLWVSPEDYSKGKVRFASALIFDVFPGDFGYAKYLL